MDPVYFSRATSTAHIPTRGSAVAAGFDLFADTTAPILIKGGAGYVAVDTGIRVRIPLGHYGRIAPRSGLALRQHIDVGAGVIDCDYNGTIVVLLASIRGGETEYVAVDPTKAIAQLIIEACSYVSAVVVEELPPSGAEDHAGFGSTDAAKPDQSLDLDIDSLKVSEPEPLDDLFE